MGVTIGYNGLQESIKFKDVREEERGKSGCIDIEGGGDEVTKLGEAVHYNEDGVMAEGYHGEGCDEILGDAFPLFRGDGARLEEAGRALMAWFHHLARVPRCNVLKYSFLRVRLI